MKIAVIGTGYVGLVTGACLADIGHTVVCMDIDESKIASLTKGQVPIYEPGLNELVAANTQQSRLTFTTNLAQAMTGAQAVFLALPTPPNQDGSADISRTLALAPKLAAQLQDYTVVVNKSTVPVGTTQKIQQAIAKHTQKPFDVVSNPEFLREGHAIQDFMQPHSIVVGSSSDRARQVMQQVYEPFAQKGCAVTFMDEHSAEVAKYAMNTMLANKISMVNELANVCDAVGADIESVRAVVGADPRIGNQFLAPGAGYGGSCFPKDVRALISTAAVHNCDMPIAKAVVQTNLAQRGVLLTKIKRHFGEDLSGKTFAVWGLAFKPDTDDLREAPALVIIDGLVAAGAKVRASDPVANANARQMYPDQSAVKIVDDHMAAVDQADALVLVTEWQQFRAPDFRQITQKLKQPVIFDGRNIYDPAELRSLGFSYYGIGRGL